MQKLNSIIWKYIYSDELPLEARMANMIYLVGIAAAFITMVSRIAMGSHKYLILVILAITCSVVGLMYISNRFRLYTLCRWIMAVVLCDILFPLGYFALGGTGSSMTGYFVMSIALVFLLIWGKGRTIFLVIHILLAIFCYYSERLPFFSRFIADTRDTDRTLDHIQTFVIMGLYLGVIFMFQNRIYREERKKRDLMEKDWKDALVQAVRASKAKGDFLSNMSHEMRTPMNAIIGMTAIGKNAKDTEKKDYAFGKIENASTHLLGVINDILDMSKIEANKLELSPILFNFEKMLQKVVNVINFRVEERGQSFYVTIDKKIPRSLIGDDQRLAQVITNLLSNAVKFTPEGGTIRLNAQLAGEEEDLQTIQIEVSDTGIGISREQQDRLFTSFEQAESSTTRKFGGTGLGLAISRRIIEMMNGRIWIESELGRGATFAFTVRLRRAEASLRPLLDPGVNWSNVRVLAVDDEPEIRNYFMDIAQRFGITCDAAESGEEALTLIEKNGYYDIYFIDWKMPGMNGLELARKIRQRKEGNSVVTMISAAEMSIVEEEAKKTGVDKFLSKPLFPSDIADLINACLGVPARGAAAAAEESSADRFESYRLLLVEDMEINREIVIALLEPTALNIDCATNGSEAVRMFSENPDSYDMIFMDIQMPEMDGYEATRRIRTLDVPKARSIPIVAMTANVFREDIERALASGMNDHVGKPLDFEEVLARLRRYLVKEDSSNARLIRYGEQENEVAWKYGIAWSKELETGNKDIDSQHKQIFRLTSNLTAACIRGEGFFMLEETLDFLAAYTIRHFADEEELQRQCGFPEYAEHKKQHEDFTKTVAGLVAEFKTNGSSVELLDKVNSLIVRWLIQHIKQEDFKISAYINSRKKAL
jgi:hemerythrin-like metal-binding protein